jgi:hypothetical protein
MHIKISKKNLSDAEKQVAWFGLQASWDKQYVGAPRPCGCKSNSAIID